MKIVYSFVVDGGPKFLIQTKVFLHTLIACGVAPDDIVAQITPATAPAVRDIINSYGVRTVPLQPILDGRYCNKIAQLDALCGMAADSFVLCDTDLAFVEAITPMVKPGVLSAKPVDGNNPPLQILNQFAAATGIEVPKELARTSWASGWTWPSNCNGGLYIIPASMLAALKPLWFHYASRALASGETLGMWARQADQIGFALAVVAMGQSVEPLPIDYNFPTHRQDAFDRMCFNSPKILHYHGKQRKNGLLKNTGHPVIDAAIDRVNAQLQTMAAEHEDAGFFTRWKLASGRLFRRESEAPKFLGAILAVVLFLRKSPRAVLRIIARL
ncbi:MAG TPA: hypothetical protein VIV82_06595 [Verrucomicrobiae bacterium]|jgi:hypothetical protein